MRRITAIAAFVAALGACGGGGDDRAAQVGGARDDSEEGGAVDYSLDHGGEDPVGPGRAELEATLLTVDDLPDGMIDLGSRYSHFEICGMRTEEPPDGGRLPSRAVAFAVADDPIVPDVFEKIIVSPEGEATGVFQRVPATLAMNCGTGAEVDGLLFRSTSDLAVPTFGDETVAKRVTIDHLATGTSVGMDLLYARAGDTIVAVGVVEPEGNTDRLSLLASLAFDQATAMQTPAP